MHFDLASALCRLIYMSAASLTVLDARRLGDHALRTEGRVFTVESRDAGSGYHLLCICGV